MQRIKSISRSATRSLSYFRAHPQKLSANAASAAASTKSSSPATPSTATPTETLSKPTEETSYSHKPLKDPMAAFSESEVKEIKKDIEEQGRRAYSYGYALIGGGMAVVLAFVAVKQFK